MTKKKLSVQDVSRLLSDPSPQARVDTAVKLSNDFDHGTLSDSERKLASDIFRIMVRDAEVRVREALSKNLKENPGVPHDVAMALAKDVDSVALPVLQFSAVLSDDDLLEIVRSQGPTKQVAIAKRPTVSAVVSDALVETHNVDVVASLVANEGADITEQTFNKVVEEFGDNEKVQAPMVHRSKLPVTIAERLVNRVSEQLRNHLMEHHELSPEVAGDLVLQSRERATLGLLGPGSGDEDVELLVRQLKANNRLTPSIIIRALCMGDLAFAEAAMALRGNIPVTNARILIHDSGNLGLKAVYDKAKMPAAYYPAARAAIDVARENEYDGGERDRERYCRRAIERILTQYGDLGIEFDSDDLDYLLGKMGQIGGPAA